MSSQLDEAFERLERMSISVSSPDRSVSGKYNLVNGLSLDIDSKILREHDEKSLAEQVRRVIGLVNRGFNAGMETVVNKAVDAPPDPDPEARKRRAELDAVVAGLVEEAVSPRGLVKVRVRGDGDLSVSYRPGTLSRVDVSPEVLAAETVATLNAAIDALDAKRRRAAIDIVESPAKD